MIDSTKTIVIFNDDNNSFENIIFSLMKDCNHTLQQAEQCAWIIHNTGKYSVKSGDFLDLIPICEALTEAGINAIIT